MSKTPYATETARAILESWRPTHQSRQWVEPDGAAHVGCHYSVRALARGCRAPCHNMSETNKLYQLTRLESRKTTCADCRFYPCPTTDPTDQGHGFKPALLPLCFAFRPSHPKKDDTNAHLHL